MFQVYSKLIIKLHTHTHTHLYILHACVCVHACCVHSQSYLTLCDPVDCSPPGSSVHGISQVRILEWVAISCSRRSSQPKNWTWVSCPSCIGGRILHHLRYLGRPYTFVRTYIYIYMYKFSEPFPLLIITNTEYISLCYTVRPCCPFILYK